MVAMTTDDWRYQLEHSLPHVTYRLAPGHYEAPLVYLAGHGSIELVALEPGTVTMDANFLTRGVGMLGFKDITFDRGAGRSGYQFSCMSTNLWFDNCNGRSVGKGGFMQGKARCSLYIVSGPGLDSVWDFSQADLPEQLIDTQGASYTEWLGSPRPRDGLRGRVVFLLPSMKQAAIHLGAGNAYLVNFHIIGKGSPTGLRLCRGMKAHIVTHATVDGLPVGVDGFAHGIAAVSNCDLTINQGEDSTQPFAFDNCDVGVYADDEDRVKMVNVSGLSR